MNNFYEELKRYFEVTPQDKVLEDWAKSEEFDNVGPTVEEFINFSQQYNTQTSNSNNWCIPTMNDQISPNFTSGLFIHINSYQFNSKFKKQQSLNDLYDRYLLLKSEDV